MEEVTMGVEGPLEGAGSDQPSGHMDPLPDPQNVTGALQGDGAGIDHNQLFYREFRQSDLATLHAWERGHGLPPSPLDLLPKFGLVVGTSGHPLAMGFLLQTDTKASYVESLLTDPCSSKIRTARAASEVVWLLLKAAQARGDRFIRAVTLRSGVVSLARRLHGRVTDHSVIEVAL